MTTRFILTIECDNAAFGEDARDEVARILTEAALKVEQGQRAFSLHDWNGNKVGSVSFQKGAAK